jgi:hypothetical protein
MAGDTGSVATSTHKATLMHEFILVDLTTQMHYLPRSMQTWPRERVLAWLRVWGDVWKIDSVGPYETPNAFAFRSWCGRWTNCELTTDGRMYIPGTRVKAWADEE